jgi:hypothetical protein
MARVRFGSLVDITPSNCDVRSYPESGRGFLRSRLAALPEWFHTARMGKTPRVVFHPKRIAEGDWQIEAHFPGAEIRYITGLTDKADIDDWLGGSRKIAWLRSQGYAK